MNTIRMDFPIQKQVHLLFLLDNGDPTGFEYDEDLQRYNSENAKKTFNIFESVLQSLDTEPMSSHLHERLDSIKKHQVLENPSKFKESPEIKKAVISYKDNMVLVLVSSAQYLKLEEQLITNNVRLNYKNVLKKANINLDVNSELFLIVQNSRMIEMSNMFSSWIVFNIWEKLKSSKDLGEQLPNFKVTLENLEKSEYLKDVLFLYMMRYLELNEKLNIIYSHHLEKVLKNIIKENKKVSKRKTEINFIRKALSSLDVYPMATIPPGYCLILCVDKDRPGAENEKQTIKEVFEAMKFHVDSVMNPTNEDVKIKLEEIGKTKYCFYDSFFLWIISHGDETSMSLADGTRYSREQLIDQFSQEKTLIKKPKVFFFVSCRGNQSVTINKDASKFNILF